VSCLTSLTDRDLLAELGGKIACQI
jgi:hypothetical protein